MKVTFEFDTDSADFNPIDLEVIKNADSLWYCLNEIKQQLREWYNHDSRGEIPISEVCDTINDIIEENLNTKKLELDF